MTFDKPPIVYHTYPLARCLRPFADGIKRPSRLSANMALLLYNCARYNLA
jgi:hypothetical protein